MNEPLLWTIQEAARQCSVSPRTIQRWVKSGAVPAVKMPARFIRIPSAAIRAFLIQPGEVSLPPPSLRESEPCAAQRLAEIIRFPRQGQTRR